MGEILFGTKYSRINQVKFVEDSPPPKKKLKWYNLHDPVKFAEDSL